MLESFGVLNLWTYLAGVVFIIILPGPNTLYVLKTGVSRGVRAGYTAALGVFIGDAILIFCAYIGVASLIRTTPFLFTLVRFSARFTCCSSAQNPLRHLRAEGAGATAAD